MYVNVKPEHIFLKRNQNDQNLFLIGIWYASMQCNIGWRWNCNNKTFTQVQIVDCHHLSETMFKN